MYIYILNEKIKYKKSNEKTFIKFQFYFDSLGILYGLALIIYIYPDYIYIYIYIYTYILYIYIIYMNKKRTHNLSKPAIIFLISGTLSMCIQNTNENTHNLAT